MVVRVFCAICVGCAFALDGSLVPLGRKRAVSSIVAKAATTTTVATDGSRCSERRPTGRPSVAKMISGEPPVTVLSLLDRGATVCCHSYRVAWRNRRFRPTAR